MTQYSSFETAKSEIETIFLLVYMLLLTSQLTIAPNNILRVLLTA